MDKIIKSHEEYDEHKMKELKKEKVKRYIKKAGIVISVGVAGFVGYKFGIIASMNTIQGIGKCVCNALSEEAGDLFCEQWNRGVDEYFSKK